MAFTKKIKEELLTATARHCCVCHKSLGTKAEVHHITPQSQGGKDTFENGIVLCFDCHADAGHYFADHPRGIKFSPSELKKQKEAWIEIVKNNQIPSKKENQIQVRYLITKEFQVIKNIANKDFSEIPIEDCLLMENEQLIFFKQLYKNQEYRSGEWVNNIFLTHNEYINNHNGETTFLSGEENELSFLHIRKPTKEEIKLHCIKDPLNKYLFQKEFPIEKIAKVYTHYPSECGCGERNYLEERFVFRPLYFSFLLLTNITTEYIKYESVDINRKETNNKEILNLPNLLIKPNQSILIPLGMFLSDFDGMEKIEETILKEIPGDYSITLEHSSAKNGASVDFIHNHIEAEKINYNVLGTKYTEDIHKFDFSNLYWIDGFWNCGSCPHLFFEQKDSTLIYKGEIFNKKPNCIASYRINVNDSTKNIIIAELENEITIIQEIKVNDKIITSNIELHKGDEYRIKVKESDILEITGYYKCHSELYKELSLFEKHFLINRYKNNYA